VEQPLGQPRRNGCAVLIYLLPAFVLVSGVTLPVKAPIPLNKRHFCCITMLVVKPSFHELNNPDLSQRCARTRKTVIKLLEEFLKRNPTNLVLSHGPCTMLCLTNTTLGSLSKFNIPF